MHIPQMHPQDNKKIDQGKPEANEEKKKCIEVNAKDQMLDEIPMPSP